MLDSDHSIPDPLPDELAALRRENAILRETLDAIDGTVVVYDAQRRYVMANSAYHAHFPYLPPDRELSGMLFEDVLGLSIDAGTVPDPTAYSDRAAFVARRIGEVNRGEIAPREVYEPASGKWYMIRARLTPSGSRVALRVDIDEQKRLQEELAAARHAAEAAARAKSLFLANISHELRTPLNAVINFARLIHDQVMQPLGPARCAAYAQDIHESGQHLLNLVEDLIDLARAESGRLELQHHPVNLRATILSVCRLLQPEADAAKVTLMRAVPGDLPAVHGDATRLRQVLFNLLNNAIKYCAPGDHVTVGSAVAASGDVLISVADTGPGIAAEDLQRVMQPFERGTGTAAQRPGAGLGLALVNHLVTLHGGTLELHSVPEQGTTAYVSLPATRVLLPATSTA